MLQVKGHVRKTELRESYGQRGIGIDASSEEGKLLWRLANAADDTLNKFVDQAIERDAETLLELGEEESMQIEPNHLRTSGLWRSYLGGKLEPAYDELMHILVMQEGAVSQEELLTKTLAGYGVERLTELSGVETPEHEALLKIATRSLFETNIFADPVELCHMEWQDDPTHPAIGLWSHVELSYLSD